MKIFTVVVFLLLSGCGTISGQEIQKAKSSGAPIIISYMSATGPNHLVSPTDASVSIHFQNISNKTIKYVDFTVVGYDSVGGAITPKYNLNLSQSVNLRHTGFIEPGKTNWNYTGWERVWLKTWVYCLELTSLIVTYSDGSTQKVGQSRIPQTLTSKVNNAHFSQNCKLPAR